MGTILMQPLSYVSQLEHGTFFTAPRRSGDISSAASSGNHCRLSLGRNSALTERDALIGSASVSVEEDS